jgi:cytochrome c-type biogenesis protein CcmH
MSASTLLWPRGAHIRRVASAGVLLLAAVAALAYLHFGTPTGVEPAPDGSVSGEGAYIARLEAHLRSQPRDGRGWVLLARSYFEDDRYADAAAAFERAMAASPKVGRDPAVLCEYADALGIAQGSLDGRPTELITQALSIDPLHPVALEMAGSAAFEKGRYADAAKHWKLLLAALAPQSERYRELAAAIVRAERKAAVSLPAS